MAPSSGPGGSKGVKISSSVSLREKINASAISGIYEGIAKRTRAVRMRMSAHSAEVMGTTPSRTLVAPDLIEAFLKLSILPTLSYYDFSDAIHFRLPLPNTHPDFIELYERVVTPYNADEFEKALVSCNISHHYPLLLHNLRRGFPLGHLPPLHETIIIPNHQSVYEHPDVIEQYISDEIAAGRMAGPFSCADMHLIMRGHFYVSPLIVATQIQGPGIPPKHRVCRNLSKDGRDSKGHIVPSVNSFTQKNLFPTRFDTAVKVADMVSPILSPNILLFQLYFIRPTWSYSTTITLIITVYLPTFTFTHTTLYSGCYCTTRHAGLHSRYSEIPSHLSNTPRTQTFPCGSGSLRSFLRRSCFLFWCCPG
ncbi:hypothetical protein HHX47_DHR9000276 [Lentinula edodes]|nr:hypothetical protein HHX47_DHR9000276 [Lentinula edodes]